MHLQAQGFAILRVAELLQQRHAHGRICREAEHRAAAFVPDQGVAWRLVIPQAQACGVDGQACPYLDLAQRALRLQPPPPLVDFVQYAFHRLGQKAEVLLEDVIDRAGAHHVDGVLFAEHAGEEDEWRLRRQVACILQCLAARIAWQDEIGQYQVEFASLQCLDHTVMVEDLLGMHQGVAVALQRKLGQFGIVWAVLDEQDADVLWRWHIYPVRERGSR